MNSDKKRIAELESKVTRLESIIEKLLDKIEDLTHRKNSRNSSVPPSKDENRPLKNQSLRTKSGKKVGGQPGHKGTTLKMVEDPDQIIDYKPDFCNCCGNDLSNTPEALMLKRQVVDIPVIFPKYTEHRIFKKTCSCGHQNKSVFPENIRATISYGTNIQATIAYMHTCQYLPFERMSEFFKDVCNLPISQGTICNLLNGFALKAQPASLCIAHSLRELIFLEQRFESNWATNFKRILYEALELKKKLKPEQYKNPILERDHIKIALEALLESPVPENQKKLRAFHKRMIKHKAYILTFLQHFNVPADNNASERAIRNVKVKQSIWPV